MNSDEIRNAFLTFFERKGHTVVPSSSLVPHGDPTLLLTSAGMVQFKPYFLGEATPPNNRLASCQKCFRTTDIDEVGDTTHLTFFEMLGNFSVGDYFKKEAIQWAWEFVTEHLRLPEERLWITIYLDDDEAEGYWLELGVPKERIVRCGEEDNFWGPAGETGPCGPCSEIHYDFGEEAGCGRPDCDPSCDCERFTEIWNLVFTQYDMDENGNLAYLKSPNIDTGMGLERTATLMQGRNNLYQTDLFAPIIEHIEKITGGKYGESETVTRAMRIVAEHSRAVTFLIADGVLPANDGRGYVLRRVLRRAALFGRKLGLKEAFIAGLAKVVIEQMGGLYPELSRGRKYILDVINIEENKFYETLTTGMNMLEQIIDSNRARGITEVSGEQAFRLYDTYGFPVEITAEIAADNDMAVDLDGFEREMGAQRERAREAKKFGLDDKSRRKFYEDLGLPATEFVGYEALSRETRVLAIIAGGERVDRASQGQEIELILAETPFYGEMGGQVGDIGEIRSSEGQVEIADTQRPIDSIAVHKGTVANGGVSVGDSVTASVDRERRLDIARNHTATHLLHKALRQVLGEQVQQGGSLVVPDHFRFDYTHLVALSEGELEEVRRIVNENIRRDLVVNARVVPYRQAIEDGALAFFGEKYGEDVRVVAIEGPDSGERVSAELCGGTHLNRTGEIGFFHITGERSVGSGLRRIEAVTGREAEKYVEERVKVLEHISERLDSNPVEAYRKLMDVLSELNAERKRARDLEAQLLRKTAESLLDRVVQVDGVKVLAARVSASNMDVLRETGDWLKEKLGSGVIVLGAVLDGNPRFLAMVTPDLTGRGIHAGKIIKQVAQVTGGGGGGKAEMAQAGGRDKGKMDEALSLVPELVGVSD
ncbi:MAG: alanine--tRNA ligase [Dehalococcoidia bacterium]